MPHSSPWQLVKDRIVIIIIFFGVTSAVLIHARALRLTYQASSAPVSMASAVEAQEVLVCFVHGRFLVHRRYLGQVQEVRLFSNGVYSPGSWSVGLLGDPASSHWDTL